MPKRCSCRVFEPRWGTCPVCKRRIRLTVWERIVWHGSRRDRCLGSGRHALDLVLGLRVRI